MQELAKKDEVRGHHSTGLVIQRDKKAEITLFSVSPFGLEAVAFIEAEGAHMFFAAIDFNLLRRVGTLK